MGSLQVRRSRLRESQTRWTQPRPPLTLERSGHLRATSLLRVKQRRDPWNRSTLLVNRTKTMGGKRFGE